jgi:hypothetical protein
MEQMRKGKPLLSPWGRRREERRSSGSWAWTLSVSQFHSLLFPFSAIERQGNAHGAELSLATGYSLQGKN